ncbi:DUF2184 domain-containing protein [Brevibacillus halotolerans]|uniref:DUF2184 domain-containing protein n=1 Tax=Brevibacillus TaxID=55080 RepID=UPI00215C63AC|nr:MULTISPECIES: DUF2184 domain-containing protein [Brevibacillus]MCR8961655.1 DUF2184 domain-containing protein [Brevibacillus laterosporus]MCZ0833810.1 DUF2184 domain-containing protein [Brevibacillus halotolerans]
MTAPKAPLARKVHTIDGLGPSMMMNDAAIGSGMAFLIGELEKRDPRLLEPLSSVTWMRDIVSKTGGGWVDFTSNQFIDYATTGGNEDGIIGGETNDIPVMQANTTKDIYKVFNFANILKVPFIDQQKLQNIGRSLDDILDKGIRLNYNKSIDNIVYTGVPSAGVYGLVNSPDITASAVAAGESGQTKWNKKTPDEILADINAIITDTWAASEYDLTGMANHILIPPQQYAYLVGTKVSEAGNISILQFLLDNNIGKNQGIDLTIAPSRWCSEAGTGGTDRMVAYVNDEDRVNFDLTVPLSRVMTQTEVTQMAYLTAYTAQIGQVKFLYTQCARYGDGI